MYFSKNSNYFLYLIRKFLFRNHKKSSKYRPPLPARQNFASEETPTAYFLHRYAVLCVGLCYIIEISMDTKKLIPIIIVIIVLAGAIGFWFWSQQQELTEPEPAEQVKEKGVMETTKDIGESVPEIQTNVGEKVPEINPIDRANPYKYENPLR